MRCTACDHAGDILLRSELFPGFPFQLCRSCVAFYVTLDDKGVEEFREYFQTKCILEHAPIDRLWRA